MIKKLTIRNFKSIEEQTYDFTRFDLLVGRNNCGKSTVLQALAIWQFCIEEFRRIKRTGKSGIQVILPNFTALPVPEFNLLWTKRTHRKYPFKKKQEYILIDILVEWLDEEGHPYSFEVQLRYSSRQTIYAIPKDGLDKFRELENLKKFPVIAYVPPFSGLNPTEEWRDDGPIRKQIGQAQPGSVLRNLLLRVWQTPKDDKTGEHAWEEITKIVSDWFSVTLIPPEYEKGIDTQILCEYEENKQRFDIISGGSGFHQTLTLLAFLYGYKPTTILLDEPDAHLHVNLQREILDYFKRKSNEKKVQFLIATHAEALIDGVDPSQIISLLTHVPVRVNSTPEVIRAMSEVSNTELSQLRFSPIILYVEGESDERILRAWADRCGATDVFLKICIHIMGGGNKKEMKENAKRHYEALKQIIPNAGWLTLFDYDEDKSWHPSADDPAVSVFEWRRKNIENYLLAPDAWMRAAAVESGLPSDGPFFAPIINDFFAGENLTLPHNQIWRNLTANVFSVVDGKKLLFENDNSLFQQLRKNNPPIELIREKIAANMTADEIHNDVYNFFEKLRQVVDAE